MRKFYIIWLLSLYSIMISAQWHILNEGSNLPLSTMDFIDKTLGYAISDSSLYRSDDVGETWQKIDCPKCDFRFMKLDFVTENVGYAYGYVDDFYGVLKTTDGGVSWTQMFDIRGTVELVAASEDVVWLVTNYDILRSVDGGKSFNYVFEGTGLNISLNISDHQGADTLLVGGIIRKGEINYEIDVYTIHTFDGGKTWHPNVLGDYSAVVELKLVDDSTVYMVGTKQVKSDNEVNAFRFTYDLVRSTDFLGTTSVISQRNLPYAGLHFIDSFNGLALFEVSNGYEIYSTSDSGKNWNSVGIDVLPRGLGFSGQFFSFEDNSGYFYYTSGNSGWGWFGGTNDIMAINMRYYNGGETWEQLNFSYKFKDVTALEDNKALIVGGYSMLHFTAQGNVFEVDQNNGSWHNSSVVPNDPIEMSFINDSVGFIHAYSDLFYFWDKTTDGGKTWQVDTTFNNARVVYFGDSHIWMIKALQEAEGKWNYWLLNSSDLGVNWNKVVKTSSSVESMVFTDAQNGWLLSYSDTLTYYHKESGFEVQNTGSKSNLNKLHFIDNQHGWITGGFYSSFSNEFSPLLLKTIDGGKTWDDITSNKYIINDLSFSDADNGWAVGHDSLIRGVVLKTSDGGKSWKEQTRPLKGILNAIDYKNGYGYAAGTNGLILTYKDTTVSIEKDVLTNSELQLSVFPNPASEQTSFRFYLPDKSFVEVNIKDQLGRTVASVHKGILIQGFNHLTWQIPNIITGVYFIEIKADSHVEIVPIIIY